MEREFKGILALYVKNAGIKNTRTTGPTLRRKMMEQSGIRQWVERNAKGLMPKIPRDYRKKAGGKG